MNDGMQGYINILDEIRLRDNITFAALFIMNFECLKDYLVSQMRDFLSDEFMAKEGNLQTVESQKYKDEVKRLSSNSNKLSAALAWFEELEAINQDDIKIFYEARDRRNSITHKLVEELMQGFSKEDTSLFSSMLGLYRKIDRWWINEVEIPISGDFEPNEYDSNNVIGGQAVILSLINDVALGKTEACSELLQLLRDGSSSEKSDE